jgi:hypothetical protein
MSIRKLRIIKFPLSASNERKVRTNYKLLNNLAANTSEEKVFNSIGIHTRKTAYKVLGELYNNYVIQENEKIDNIKKQKKNVKNSNLFIKSIALFSEQIIRPIKVKNRKPIVKFDKLSSFIANWYKKNPNQMLSLKLGSTKADVILPLNLNV